MNIRSALSPYWAEAAILLKLGWPMTVSQLFYALMYPATLAFCGALGLDELDIASLAISVFQLVVVPIENGLRWSCLTFFSQALGGTKKKRAGITVQRSLTAAFCLWIISFGIAINCANLLVLVGQDVFIALNSQTFITILMPGCLAVFVFRVQMAYMDCLGKVMPTLVIHTIAFGICIGLEALFVFQLNMGYKGAALGLCLTLCTLPVMMTAYITVSKVHLDTWPGWSARCFLAWKEFYYNLMPSIANQLVFVSSSEMGSFIAGWLGKPQLAVQGIVFQLFIVTMQPCTGAGSAAISRIGRYMGSGDADKARQVYKLILVMLGGIGILLSGIVLLLKNEIPKIFSADYETNEIFQTIIYFICLYIVCITTAWGHIAALRGCNYHNTCVVIALIGLWVVGHPIGLTLIFAAGWGMIGLWTGYVIASAAWNLLGIVAICRVNWYATSLNVSSLADKETDIEGFVSHNENKPLLNGTFSHGYSKMESESHKHTSSWKMFRTKIPVIFALIAYFIIAILIRTTVPQPEVKVQPNSTQPFTNFSSTIIPSTSVHLNMHDWKPLSF